MVSFHSYAKLPEGICKILGDGSPVGESLQHTPAVLVSQWVWFPLNHLAPRSSGAHSTRVLLPRPSQIRVSNPPNKPSFRITVSKLIRLSPGSLRENWSASQSPLSSSGPDMAYQMLSKLWLMVGNHLRQVLKNVHMLPFFVEALIGMQKSKSGKYPKMSQRSPPTGEALLLATCRIIPRIVTGRPW